MEITEQLVKDLAQDKLSGEQERELFKAIVSNEEFRERLEVFLSENNKNALYRKKSEPTSFSAYSPSGKPMTHISETLTPRQKAKLYQ